MNQPKKETVRITLPPRPSVNPGGAPVIKKETVRINLPARPILRTTPPVDPAAAEGETDRAPVIQPPTVPMPKPLTAPPAPAGLRPPTGPLRPPPAHGFSTPTVPRPPGSAPIVPVPPRPPGVPPIVSPRLPGALATAPVPLVSAPPPSSVSAPGAPVAPRPPIITGKAPPPAAPTVPLADDDVMPVPAVPVFRPTGLKMDAARVDAPPVPKTGPAPTVRVDRAPPLLSPTFVPSPMTTPLDEGGPAPVRDALPLWAYVVVFALALLVFGVQLAAYLAPVVEP